MSTTINRKRYYGVLIPQEALKQASDIFFQDEALSLEINKRMAFLQQKQTSIKNEQDSRKGKKHDCGNQVSNQNFDETQQVQKFKYCHETKNTSGYRVILATFANILEASNGDHTLFEKIKVACDEGGNWVGEHYYQYEVSDNIVGRERASAIVSWLFGFLNIQFVFLTIGETELSESS